MSLELKFLRHSFHPVIFLPTQYRILDLTESAEPVDTLKSEYSIGRYLEPRKALYQDEIFQNSSGGPRNIHLGIDIGAPAGTPVHAVADGRIFCAHINSAPGDYGGTLITEHQIEDLRFWILHGHLSHGSVSTHRAFDPIRKGELIAKLGERSENGGWNPHLHFQISLEEPVVCDMPGTTNESGLAKSLKIYPDPRWILGQIY